MIRLNFPLLFPSFRLKQGMKMKRRVYFRGRLQCMLMWREHDVNQSSIVVPTNPLTLPPPHSHMLAGVTPAVSIALFPLSLHLSHLYRSQIQSCKPLRPLLCTLTNVINLKRIHPERFALHFPVFCSASLSVFICSFSVSCFSSSHSISMSALIRLLFAATH